MSTGHYGYCSNCGLELPPPSSAAHQCPVGFANMYLPFLGGLNPAQVRMIVRDELERVLPKEKP